MAFLLLFLTCATLLCEDKSLKLLHLTFHKGCVREVEGVAKALGLELTTWYIHDLPPHFFDEQTQGNALYNIGHERAERIWEKHKQFFDQFDAIMTSDTVALSRIFLQNHCAQPLIIWISNRFDYHDGASLDCIFPDGEFYELLRKAAVSPAVTIVASCPYEHYYAKQRGVDTGNLVIKPCAAFIEDIQKPVIPSSINKSVSFFVPNYHNEALLSKKCKALQIPHYKGPFAGPQELGEFKGVIHLPYSWSTIALYMNTQMGLPYFIPTPSFMKVLARRGNYWHQNGEMLFQHSLFHLSEWYTKENQDFFVYFDSWKDLKKKIVKSDFPFLKKRVKAAAERHKEVMLSRWKELFKKLQKKDPS